MNKQANSVATSNRLTEHETKFVLLNRYSASIVSWLQARCLPDPEYPAGIVYSIYYDTYHWRFLREKINSDFFKTKIRLRWYADIDTKQIGERVFLEVKRKVGACRRKERFDTSFRGPRLSRISLEHSDLLKVRTYLNDHEIITPEPVWPAFVICYRRQRYVEPVSQSRLCLDYDICVPRVNHMLVRTAIPPRLHQAVFEVKGNVNRLPSILHPLTSLGCRKESFSKYSVCYQHIIDGS